ncbi:MAG: putative synthase protein, partial [Proteobacteria bacterium]|nr:putative synthase protein [Pseudomonadota bacterium]
EAKSALLGGLVGFLPNAYFAVRFGRRDPTKTAKDVVRSFYLGESVKLLFTALLFVLVFQLPGILFMPLIIGFVSVIMVFWFALLLRSN